MSPTSQHYRWIKQKQEAILTDKTTVTGLSSAAQNQSEQTSQAMLTEAQRWSGSPFLFLSSFLPAKDKHAGAISEKYI